MLFASPGLREIGVVVLEDFILVAVPELAMQRGLGVLGPAGSFRAAVFYCAFVGRFIWLGHQGLSFARQRLDEGWRIRCCPAKVQ